jgi:hypothetical protein
MTFFQRLTDEQNYKEIQVQYDSTYVPHPFAATLKEMHFFHNLVIIVKGNNTYPSNLRPFANKIKVDV